MACCDLSVLHKRLNDVNTVFKHKSENQNELLERYAHIYDGRVA